jgi:epoxyqueuosine reductase
VLAGWLEQQVGHSLPHRIYADTGPLLERELGQRAGLGWIGKNTCLIHPRLGSSFLLGEILLTLSLPPDPPMVEDRCGRCTRCLEACPTGCIRADRTLDAERCLSYLTIERRGGIPLPLRAGVGAWMFGCDVCQRVCPWNARFAAPPAPAAWPHRPDLENLTARDLLEAEAPALRAWMRGSPLERPHRGGLLRNAAVVAGNSGDRSLAAPLARRLASDPDPSVRAHAAWALGRLGGREARAALETSQATEQEVDVLKEILHARQGFGA